MTASTITIQPILNIHSMVGGKASRIVLSEEDHAIGLVAALAAVRQTGEANAILVPRGPMSARHVEADPPPFHTSIPCGFGFRMNT